MPRLFHGIPRLPSCLPPYTSPFPAYRNISRVIWLLLARWGLHLRCQSIVVGTCLVIGEFSIRIPRKGRIKAREGRKVQPSTSATRRSIVIGLFWGNLLVSPRKGRIKGIEGRKLQLNQLLRQINLFLLNVQFIQYHACPPHHPFPVAQVSSSVTSVFRSRMYDELMMHAESTAVCAGAGSECHAWSGKYSVYVSRAKVELKEEKEGRFKPSTPANRALPVGLFH